MVHLLAEQFDTKSNVKLGGFRSQLQASYVSSYTEELLYNETFFLWMTIYMYIYYHMPGVFETRGKVIHRNRITQWRILFIFDLLLCK